MKLIHLTLAFVLFIVAVRVLNSRFFQSLLNIQVGGTPTETLGVVGMLLITAVGIIRIMADRS